ncbi:cytochrome P450 3A28 [Galendromus occidentalis]|uniref:Cytochrome P450 3A28 n=1 Tax=Galendromus occidentalis TaxID=34638 RepID=A0AAJ6VWN2_9ACAR|nr:cytochrome P450 3A28 [Galendromus occidentalis]
MNDIVEFVQRLPRRDPRDLLGEFGAFNLFAIWWTSVLVSLVVGWVVQRRYRHQQFKRWGIPGPEADSLIFGHHLTIHKDPEEVLNRWAKQYGPVFGHYIGDVPVLNICDPDMVKEVFVKSVSIFRERPPVPLSQYPVDQTLLLVPHQRWKRVRVMLSPAFSASKLKFMMNLMNQSAETLLGVIAKYARTREAVCFFDLSQKVTLDVIARCALATKINCLHDDKDKFLNDVRGFLANSDHLAYHLALGLPIIERLLLVISRFTSSYALMTGLMENIHEVVKSRRDRGVRMEDMIQLMMDAAESGSDRITDDEIAANAFLFLVGGYETTAITTTMASFLLSKHPDEQEKLYAEISAVWNTDEALNYEQVSKLKQTEAFLLETLRMYSPVITMVSRLGDQEIKLGGHTIPGGVRIQAAVSSIHMNEKFWPEPEKFSPERFLDNHASSQPHYLAFGAGAKMCLGKRFALLEMKITLAHILKHFELKLATPGQEVPKRKLVNVSLVPVGDVPLIVERRP